jgi:hypothetical protein
MLRVDRETDILPEPNEEGSLSENGKTSVMLLHVDVLPSWLTSFTSVLHHILISAEGKLISLHSI